MYFIHLQDFIYLQLPAGTVKRLRLNTTEHATSASPPTTTAANKGSKALASGPPSGTSTSFINTTEHATKRSFEQQSHEGSRKSSGSGDPVVRCTGQLAKILLVWIDAGTGLTFAVTNLTQSCKIFRNKTRHQLTHEDAVDMMKYKKMEKRAFLFKATLDDSFRLCNLVYYNADNKQFNKSVARLRRSDEMCT